MSAQADIAPSHNSDASRAASAAPLRAISFGDPAVAIVGSKLLYPDGTIQQTGILSFFPPDTARWIHSLIDPRYLVLPSKPEEPLFDWERGENLTYNPGPNNTVLWHFALEIKRTEVL